MHSTATHPVIVWIFESKPKGWTACLTGRVHCPDRTIPRATLLTRLQTQSAPFSINVLCCVTLKYTTLKSCFLNYLSFLFSSFFFLKVRNPRDIFYGTSDYCFFGFWTQNRFCTSIIQLSASLSLKTTKEKTKKNCTTFFRRPPSVPSYSSPSVKFYFFCITASHFTPRWHLSVLSTRKLFFN